MGIADDSMRRFSRRPFDDGLAHEALRAHAGQQFGTVLDEDADDVAFLDALADQVVGDAVGPLVDFVIGEANVFVQDGRTTRILFYRLFECPAQAAGHAGILDITDFESLDDPGQIAHDERRFLEHHAPGDHISSTACHVTPSGKSG